MRDRSSWVEPVLSLDKCVLLKDHNAVTPVRLEPAALRSRVKHSTTEPLRSHNIIDCDTRPGQLIFHEETADIMISHCASVETHYRYIINCDTRPGQLTFHEGTAVI